MSVEVTPRQRNGAAAKRLDRRDPRLPVSALYDRSVAEQLWLSLPEDCRRDHFDQKTLPDLYRPSVPPVNAGGDSTTVALNMRGLPQPMTWEIAWLLHREIGLGRRVHLGPFNSTMAALRAATSSGGHEARTAESLLLLTPEDWLRHVNVARLRGCELGRARDEEVVSIIKRFQDVLVYPYHNREWWRLDVWNPLLDPRIPRRDHEPSGRNIVNFSRLTSPWLREAAKLWLSICLETERYTWSTLKTRLDALKWLQRQIDAAGDRGPGLVEDPADLRGWVRQLITSLNGYRIASGARVGLPLNKNPRRAIMTTIEQFYTWMYDNRTEAAETLDDSRWRGLGPQYAVLFRAGDKPRLTNVKPEGMYLEDQLVAQIAEGAELLAIPKEMGGLGDLQAFHALMLLIRTGRRINEVLMMDFNPLIPLSDPSVSRTGDLVARMRYQQIKVQAGQSHSIPVDAEIVSIVRAQQAEARRFMSKMNSPNQEPRYLFLRQVSNSHGEHPYSDASLHSILGRLTERLNITDAQGNQVTISMTHRFRHTAATNLLNAGVPLHVVMHYFGHLTPEMTMHYAVTLSQTAEREFLRYKKVTSDGRPVDLSDLYQELQLAKRADRILPNGWCTMPPKQSCDRGNACLSCVQFVTDTSHRLELNRQLGETERLVEQRRSDYRAKYDTDMADDNVWLQGRRKEATSLRLILRSIDTVSDEGGAIRGAGSWSGDLSDGEKGGACPST